MELRQLEYFVAVVEEAGFTRAAERVGISQSGVSAQVRQLERELGAILIDRSRRQITLTPAGEAAFEHARSALASAAAVQQAVAEVTGLIRGRLVVGMVVGCTITPLFDALAAFRHAHPAVDVALLEDTSDRLAERVRDGSIDLAIIGAAAEPPSDLRSWTIISERLVALFAKGHPLLSQSAVCLEDLAGYPMITMPAGTGIRAAFDQACAARGIHPGVALEATAADAIADLAVRGLGVAVLSQSMAAAYAPHLQARLIDDAKIPALLALVWTTSHNPALHAFVAHSQTAFTTG